MKKLTILLSFLVVIGLLSACGSDPNISTSTNQAESSQVATEIQTVDVPAELPPQDSEVALQTVLIIGTFALEGTQNEVTTAQAAELLPFWMVLTNLLESDTAATEEINALTNQISEAMTAAQMAQIDSLDIGPQRTRALMEELGLSERIQTSESVDGSGGQGGAAAVVLKAPPREWDPAEGKAGRNYPPNRWNHSRPPAKPAVVDRDRRGAVRKHRIDRSIDRITRKANNASSSPPLRVVCRQDDSNSRHTPP